MKPISILDAKDHLPELVAKAEAGETVVLTRDGQPVAEIKPTPRKSAALRPETLAEHKKLAEYKKTHVIEAFFPSVLYNFDDLLREDLLIRPLPPDA